MGKTAFPAFPLPVCRNVSVCSFPGCCELHLNDVLGTLWHKVLSLSLSMEFIYSRCNS